MLNGERIKDLRKKNKMTQTELSNKVNSTKNTISRLERGRVSVTKTELLEHIADVLGTTTDYLLGRTDISSLEIYEVINGEDNVVYIPVYGRIPAGRPLEALEVDFGYVAVDKAMLRGGKQLIGLKVTGDSMYPKYMEDDVILVEITADVNSGDDVIAFVGDDNEATLKKYHLKDDHIELEPLNREYPIKKYGFNDRLRIFGKVKEIRREV